MLGTDRRFKDILLGILIRRYIRANASAVLRISDLDEAETRHMREFVPDGDELHMAIGVVRIIEPVHGGKYTVAPSWRRERLVSASERARRVNS